MDPRLTYIVKHKRPQVNTKSRERLGILGGQRAVLRVICLALPARHRTILGNEAVWRMEVSDFGYLDV